ncbi:MAG: hypothetical protein Q7W02_10820 [Candidatus Rokubacteria bacterium]|nr:hypothetical protein [Candidatus Rokubacteria bacterium]
MTKGLEIRAQIDTENVKGLLLINGGATVALLAFLPTVLDKPRYEWLARGILYALLTFQAGLIAAVVHNRLRRICSLLYEQHQYRPPPCEIFGKKLREPCVCHWSILFMWLSLAAFLTGSVTVFYGGLRSLEHGAASRSTMETLSTRETKTPPTIGVDRNADKQATIQTKSSAQPSLVADGPNVTTIRKNVPELVARTARALVAALLMASATFVLGTVVGYQYHAMIFDFRSSPTTTEPELSHRRLVRRWYSVGIGVGTPVCWTMDSWRTGPAYLLLLAFLVVAFWGIWWMNAALVMRRHISRLRVGWEFFWSCVSLSVVSAVSGAIMVEQAFKWLAWNITGTP